MQKKLPGYEPKKPWEVRLPPKEITECLTPDEVYDWLKNKMKAGDYVAWNPYWDFKPFNAELKKVAGIIYRFRDVFFKYEFFDRGGDCNIESRYTILDRVKLQKYCSEFWLGYKKLRHALEGTK